MLQATADEILEKETKKAEQASAKAAQQAKVEQPAKAHSAQPEHQLRPEQQVEEEPAEQWQDADAARAAAVKRKYDDTTAEPEMSGSSDPSTARTSNNHPSAVQSLD